LPSITQLNLLNGQTSGFLASQAAAASNPSAIGIYCWIVERLVGRPFRRQPGFCPAKRPLIYIRGSVL
jgi:hypothetical protein